MERLIEDAIRVKNFLPWVESDQDVLNFMRGIPADKSHLRNQLTLLHFFKIRDLPTDSFDKSIEDDTIEIVIVLPDISYTEIKEKLTVLGKLPNRKEVVLRQLLHERRDLDKILKDINGGPKKRKSESNNDVYSNENHTNINIKIRRVDNGSLEVVSSFSSQERPNVIQNIQREPSEHLDKPTTSSASVTSSTSQSSNSVPDSTVQSETGANYDPCPEFTAIYNNLVKIKSEPSTSGSTMPVTCNAPLARNNINKDYTEVAQVHNPPHVVKNVVMVKQTKETEIVNNNSSSEKKEVIKEKFNLIGFVKELSSASEYRIFQLCKQMNLSLNERPREDKLNYLLNRLFDDADEVDTVASNSSSGSETEEYNLEGKCYETEEYNLEDQLPQTFSIASPPHFIPIVGYKENTPTNDNVFTDGSKKQTFKLREPVLVPFPQALKTPLDPPNTHIRKNPVQPSRFNPAPMRDVIIPAMPPRFLDELNERREEQMHDIAPEPEAPEEAGNLTVNEDIGLNIKTESVNNNNVQPVVITDTAVAGPSNKTPRKERVLDEKLVFRLIEMFPQACPEYIRDICNGRRWTDLDDVVTVILSAPDYPKRPQRAPSPVKEVDIDEQFEIVKELLPDADPTFIRMQVEKYANDADRLKEFVNSAVEKKDYPTMKEYLRKQQLSAQQKQYTTEFSIENFIQLFPDPNKTFNDPNRVVKIDQFAAHYINIFFRNRYDRMSLKVIQNVLHQNKFNMVRSDAVLEQTMKTNDNMLRTKRKPYPLPATLENIPVLQELAYLSHKEEIKNYLLEREMQEKKERLYAKENGLMETCQCCYDDEVMLKDIFCCPNGCKFCKGCLKKSCEVAMGEGKTNFPCLADCSSEFTLQTLQSVLPPKMFSKLAQKKALAEIKAAGIEDLETCPFCDFATIPSEEDRIFRCLNPDCMKESCRMCKEPNHVPLKCEEVEKDEAVKARTYIENKMTEALIRKCWKCGTSFFKEEGCNKMTCSCGASMCYVCKQPVKDYTHFNGMGGSKFHLCPLYSNTNLLNQQNVLGAAEAAKAEVDPAKLKVDPTVGIKDHYKKRGQQLPREGHMDAIQRMNAAAFIANEFPDAREEIPGVRIELGGVIHRGRQVQLRNLIARNHYLQLIERYRNQARQPPHRNAQ